MHIITFNLLFICSVLGAYAQESTAYKDHEDKIVAFTKLEKNTKQLNFYKNKKGEVVGISSQILLSIKDNSISLKELSIKYDIKHIKKLDKNVHLFSVNNSNNIFDVITALNEDNNVIQAQPNFTRQIKHR